jgi:ABC-type nitrate/sulfonate/bicarbonate transport system permease component
VGSVPIIVITPVVLMLFGRGSGTAVIVCTIVTFFPCLINILAGMRSPAKNMFDLARALGASSFATLTKIRFPSSVPGLISASKLALPAALSGVILTEFVATGTGIGNYINSGRANFNFNQMWAGIAATLIASVLLYSMLGALEIILRRQYAPGRGRSASD